MRSRFRSYIGIFTGRAADERIADLLNRGRIAVVLDGLDEIDGELRPAVVAALDEQATTFRLVVLSRSTEMARWRATGCFGERPPWSWATYQPPTWRTTCGASGKTPVRAPARPARRAANQALGLPGPSPE
jgi:hypothetical protein